MTKPTTADLFLILAMFVAGGIVGWWLSPENLVERTITRPGDPYPVEITRTERDTAWLERVRTVTRIEAAPADTIIIDRPDSLIMTPPFVAALDTIAGGDTIGIRYRFPEHLFTLSYEPRPDSIAIITSVERVTLMQSRPWYESAGLVGLGILGGVAIDHFLIKR